MECPYCKQSAQISDTVKLNLEAYGGSRKARTKCCGALIRVYSKINFWCTETAQEGKDDWGD